MAMVGDSQSLKMLRKQLRAKNGYGNNNGFKNRTEQEQGEQKNRGRGVNSEPLNIHLCVAQYGGELVRICKGK